MLDTLYNLLPAVYRIRDLEHIENGLAVGGLQQEANNGTIQLPLKALVEVIAEQIAVLEDDLVQLYDDQFIETCADWVIPYIGDLVSFSTPHNTSSQSLRSEVAHTMRYRKRKGTATLLEQLVRDVTGWDTHVVEFFQLISSTQQLNRWRPDNKLVDLREGNGEPLARLDTPFDSLAHNVDVHTIATGRGRYNIPNIGVFIWRLGDYSLTDVPAVRAARNRGQCYFFSPSGNNTHLFTHPETGEDVAQLAGPNAVAMPISRSRLTRFLSDYYGVNKSILLTMNVGGEDVPILPDPKLPSNRLKRLINISGSLHNSLVDLSKDLTSGAKLDEAQLEELIAKSEDLNIGLDDLYRDQLMREKRDLKKLEQLITVVKDLNYSLDQSEMLISGEEGSWVTLNGMVISGGTLKVSGSLHRLTLKHCILLPGLALTVEGEPQSPLSPSLLMESSSTLVEIDHCIVGGLRVIESASVRIANSIVDATTKDRLAFAGPPAFPVSQTADRSPGGQLSIENSTLIGRVYTISLELASNTIFLAQAAPGGAPVDVVRRQDGCMRFSYVPHGSRTPRLYNCQPAKGNNAELVEPHFTSLRYGDPGYCQLLQRSPVKARQEGDSRAEFRQGIDDNVEFQQAKNEAAIRQGADDEAEMGAFHDLFQPQRETNLRLRLGEYLRFTMEPGIMYVT